MNVVRSGRAELAVSEFGDGPPVVLLHAGVTDRRSWLSTIAELTEFRTIAYDRRGFGSTVFEPEPHSWTGDLEAVLNTCNIERCVLAGNSQGGRIAIDFALANPARVAGLFLLGTAVTGAPTQEPIEESARWLVAAIDDAEHAGNLDEVNRLDAHLWLDGPNASEGRVGGAVRELFLEMNGRALRASDTGDARQSESAWGRLSTLRIPVTIAVGTADLQHIRERSAVLASQIPASDFVEFAGLGHIPQLEEPQRCAELIRDVTRRSTLSSD